MSKKKKPGYAEIAAHYRQLITDGTLAPGDAFPSLKDVHEKFDVSPTTAARAFRILRSEGLTVGRAGHGTVVADRPRVASTGAARLGRLARTGRPLGVKEKSIKHTAALLSCADPAVAEQLDVEPHDEIVVRTRVYTHEDTPSVYSISCIHPRALVSVGELLTPGPSQRFWHELYQERTGRTIARSPEMQGARPAHPYELAALDVDVTPGSVVPVLVLVNVFHDEDGPIEVWEDVYAPGRWRVADE